MKITFDVKASAVVPDADFAPEKGELEKMLISLLRDEGIDARSLSVENYSVKISDLVRDEDEKIE